MIEYQFKNKEFFKQALTHSSVDGDVAKNYERLEFLGDRVLGLCVATMLYKIFPDEPEGSLSQRFTALVCKEAVAKVALRLGLDKEMIVISSELRDNENVLCDICEAVIGAIFIEGGFVAVDKFITKNWQGLINENRAPKKDAKTCLQELVHSRGLPSPVYEMVGKQGSEHEPLFEIAVHIKDKEPISAFGKNKKIAEFDAASKMLKELTND